MTASTWWSSKQCWCVCQSMSCQAINTGLTIGTAFSWSHGNSNSIRWLIKMPSAVSFPCIPLPDFTDETSNLNKPNLTWLLLTNWVIVHSPSSWRYTNHVEMYKECHQSNIRKSATNKKPRKVTCQNPCRQQLLYENVIFSHSVWSTLTCRRLWGYHQSGQ